MLKEFKGKTAVISGAGNGFGEEFAKEAARRGMKLVLADMDAEDLARTTQQVEAMGAEVKTVCADLSQYEGVAQMLNAATTHFGSIDLLINNAGIFYRSAVWEMPRRDVQWMFEINVLSMIYAMQDAIPIMQKQGTECHIVNVSSAAGLFSNPKQAVYNATKFAVTALSESTAYDLQRAGANIGISILCPRFMKTDLHHSERHRPERHQADDPFYQSEAFLRVQKDMEKCILGGPGIDGLAQQVFDAVANDEFYIIPQDSSLLFVQKRCRNVVEKRAVLLSEFNDKPLEG